MPDRHIRSDRERCAAVGVEDGAILDIGPRADADQFVVSPDHCAEPDADILIQFDVADDMRVGRYPVAPGLRKAGLGVIQGVDRHGTASSRVSSQYNAPSDKPTGRCTFWVNERQVIVAPTEQGRALQARAGWSIIDTCGLFVIL
jgi:hypothetical protein